MILEGTIEQIGQAKLDGRLSTWNILLTSAVLYRMRSGMYWLQQICIVTVCDVLAFVAVGYRPFGHSPERLSFLSASGGVGLLMITPVVAALDAYIVSAFRYVPNSRQMDVGVGSLRVLPGVLVSLVVAYLGIGVAGIFFVIPGLILWLRWFVAAPVVAIERRGIAGALKRSARLTAGHYWRVLALLLTLWLAVLVTTFCIHAIFAGSTVGVGVVTMEIMIQSLMASYMALAIVVLYFDLCACDKEFPSG